MKTLNNKTRQHSVLRMIAVFVTTLLLMPTVAVANTTFYVYDNVKTGDKTLKLYVWESGSSDIGWPGIEVTTTGSGTTNGWTYQISTEKNRWYRLVQGRVYKQNSYKCHPFV